jgi:branched-chain amino acid transport system ATP-binding protein
MLTWGGLNLLRLNNIDVSYDKYQVIWNVSLHVNKGETVTLIGPNGSGKSTILNTISNLINLQNGEIIFNDKKIHLMPTHTRSGMGICHVLERRRIFPQLTVKQNLILGARHKKAAERRERTLHDIYKVFPRLSERSNQLANSMSGGEQQMLAIARGLMGLPKLLMIDEPFLGLSPKVILNLKQIFKDIANSGIGILFVEQNVRLALSMADRGYVLESGHLVIDGKSNDILDSNELTKVFLG